jgi:hypothetical protein
VSLSSCVRSSQQIALPAVPLARISFVTPPPLSYMPPPLVATAGLRAPRYNAPALCAAAHACTQVPDTQEVFIDTAGEGSLTLELLERQEGSDEAVMQLLWEDAMESNGVDLTDHSAWELERLEQVPRGDVAPQLGACSRARVLAQRGLGGWVAGGSRRCRRSCMLTPPFPLL